MRRGLVFLILLVLGVCAAAPAAHAQADPLTGQWSWLGGTVTVKRSGGSWVGTSDRAVQCGVARAWTIDTGGPTNFAGTVAYYQIPACTPIGRFPASFQLDASRRSLQICSNGPDASVECSTAARRVPVLGRSVGVSVVQGTVRVRVKGARRFRRLAPSEVIPTGSTLDTRKGRVRLVAALDGAGNTQTADFFSGFFKVTQRRSGLVDLRLAGRLENCGRSKRSSTAARKRKGRRLWGSGKGRFRTRGRRSAALVRGTEWLVYDRCDKSTYNAVRTGTVDVRDFGRKKTIRLTPGGRRIYIAR
jgi:hypothetical protein